MSQTQTSPLCLLQKKSVLTFSSLAVTMDIFEFSLEGKLCEKCKTSGGAMETDWP